MAGRWLGPGDFGRAQFVILFYVYGSLVRSGVFEGAMREFIHLRGRGEEEEAIRSQNVGLSYELVVSLVPGLVMFGVALWSHDPVQRLGLLVAPVAVLASSGASFLANIYMARGEFSAVTRVTVVRALVFPAALLSGVHLLGARGAVLAPVLADLLIVVLYASRASRLHLRLSFDRTRAWTLTRVGFPLGAKAILYWAYRLVGSTSVAAALPATVLGAYAFASAPIALLVKALSPVYAVLTPALWGKMAQEPQEGWLEDAAHITVALAIVGGAATNLAQVGFAPLVAAFLPQFSESVVLFDLLVINVLLLSLDAVPALVLDSALFNRQALHLRIWIGGLAINVIANVIVLWQGLGVTAIAANDLWVQTLMVVTLHAVAARYLPGPRWRSARLRLIAVTAVTGAVTMGLHFGPQTADGLAAVVLLVAGRAIVVGEVWLPMNLALRDWIRRLYTAPPVELATPLPTRRCD